MMRTVLLCAACLLITVASMPVRADWTVVDLGPAGAFRSQANGVYGSQQVGTADGQAGLWSGTAISWVDLNPLGVNSSQALAVSGGQQVGVAGNHASLWNGTAASWVDLNPVGANWSQAMAVSDGQQVGVADDHAGLWSGTAASWVDLNPVGAAWSAACGVSDGQQVGYASFGGQATYSTRAGLGSGTVTPQVGLPPTHAGLWSGTAASWVDINPAGAHTSQAMAVSGGQQVGVADGHASLWRGTAANWVDLHEFLASGYQYSEAYGIYTSGGSTWVVGSATLNGRVDAILWENVVPEPSSVLPLAGGMIGMASLALRRKRR